MPRHKGIAFKLVCLVLLSCCVIFGLTFWYNYGVSRRLIAKNIEKNAAELMIATTNQLDRVLGAVEKVPQNLAFFLESAPCDGGQMMDILKTLVENNPEIYGACISFEPYGYNRNTLAFAPYYFKGADGVAFRYLSSDYFYDDWYQIPHELGHPVWSEPYYDEGGGDIIMATYSVPFYREVLGKRRIIGIVTADISLDWLQKIVGDIQIAETGYAFLLSKNGTFVTHPRRDLIMNETIFSLAEARGDPALREVGRAMINEQSGYTPFFCTMTNKACWMGYSPLASSGWSLAVLFPQSELMADIDALNRTVWTLVLAGFLLLLFVIAGIARSITRPLRSLTSAARDIAAGNLDAPLPAKRSGDEVGHLADSFAYMQQALKQYIQDLTETTAAKEKIESELRIAHEIQMGILPKVFPPFPDHTEFEICAALEPAKEVGGDLYDFFFLDERHLCFTVGDVSGKGVPASLFMAITQTLVKTKATQGLAPHVVLERVNRDLSLDNPSLMFVTLFLGILDIETGEVTYSNGGHNPPYILRSDGSVTQLPGTNGMALGVMEDFVFRSKSVGLGPGEMLFLYTDGVTEAMDVNETLYSEARLEEKLKEVKHMPIDQMVHTIMANVHIFAGKAPQADDITILVLRFKRLGKNQEEDPPSVDG